MKETRAVSRAVLAGGMVASGLFAAAATTVVTALPAGAIATTATPNTLCSKVTQANLTDLTSQAPGANSNTTVFFIPEQTNVTVPGGGQAVDATAPGRYDPEHSPTGGTIAAGTVVNSYLFHAEKPDAAPNVVTLTAVVDFSSPILGIITTQALLISSDARYANPGTTFEPGNAKGRQFGVGATGNDAVTITNHGRRIIVSARPGDKLDELRVLVKADNPAPAQGYRMVASDGGVFVSNKSGVPFGAAQFFGSLGNIKLNKPIAAMATTPSGNGYLLVASDGGVFASGTSGAFGDASFQGSGVGLFPSTRTVVDAAIAPGNDGYWITDDLGNVKFITLPVNQGGINLTNGFGNTPNVFGAPPTLTAGEKIVSILPTPDGLGYWLTSTKGRVVARGDAEFFQGWEGTPLAKPVVALSPSKSGCGFVMVANDGGIFASGPDGAFKDAQFHGSLGNITLNQPINGIAPTPSGNGYWMFASDGGVFASGPSGAFGDAAFLGSVGDVKLNQPINGADAA